MFRFRLNHLQGVFGTSKNQQRLWRIVITLRRVRVTMVAVEKQYYIFWVCVCSLSYPELKSQEPYCIVVRGFSGCTIFSTLSHRLYDFRKRLLNIKCVFWFSLQLLSETFLILRRIQRDTVINVYTSSCRISSIVLRYWWNLNFRDIFSNNFQIYWKPVLWEPSCCMRTDGQTDKQNEANNRFSKFCERL